MFFKRNYLPITILSKKPLILGAFFEDIFRKIPEFKTWCALNADKHQSISVFLKLGYHYQSDVQVEDARKHIKNLTDNFPKINFYFFCNSQEERANIASLHPNAIFCNQNAFLRESRYFALNCKKPFDAVYLARITPAKRHALALKIPKLFMIGDYKPAESDYALNILKQLRPDTFRMVKARGIIMFYYLCKAKIGIALSKEEGAMYAAAEYGLCGLPVLTTQHVGGRQFSLSPKFTFFVDENNLTADEVARLAIELAAKTFDPKEVRQATIDVLNEHRKTYAALVRKIFDETKEGTESDYKYALNFPHKWGVRCPVLPHFRFFRTLHIPSK